jgi:hypothetical protein
LDTPNASVKGAAFGTVSNTNVNAPNRNIRSASRYGSRRPNGMFGGCRCTAALGDFCGHRKSVSLFT